MSKTIKTLTALLMISDGPESKKSLCEKFEIDNEELESLIKHSFYVKQSNMHIEQMTCSMNNKSFMNITGP